MKKYTPSVKNNNAVKEELCSEMKGLLYRIEKGKYDRRLDRDGVRDVYDTLKLSYENLENLIFTGEEDLALVSERVMGSLTALRKALDGELRSHVTAAADDLQYYLDSFTSIADGEIDALDEAEIKAKKLSWSKRRLYAKLDELKSIKDTFTEQEKRLEGEITGLERDLAELENKMIAEDNERVINELFRKISALKSKLDMLNVRRSNYSACFGVLDIIYANASEILAAGQFSMEETAKAKVLLNLGKLRAVVSEPDKAIGILKVMEKDIKEISAKVRSMDEKVFGLNTGETSVTDSAMAYKAELMRKAREKAANAENLENLERGTMTAGAATAHKEEN